MVETKTVATVRERERESYSLKNKSIACFSNAVSANCLIKLTKGKNAFINNEKIEQTKLK